VKTIRLISCVALSAAVAFGVAACGGDGSSSDTSGSSGDSKLSGAIKIDGSSTVFPFAQAAAEEFQRENPNVNISVGESGTGGGFEKFCAGETDISNASRPIDAEKEVPACKSKDVKYSGVQVANDGIAIVTNKDLKIDCMTTEQLKTLWSAKSKVDNYKQLDPEFPDQKVALFGAGTDSGTFDFFTEEINGASGDTRKDYSPTEDDNITVQGVSGDKGGLGYFGFSYYEDNVDKLNLVQVDDQSGCVAPSKETIQDGTYEPLSRPLFMYASTAALARPEVKAFLDYALANQSTIADASKIVPLTVEQLSKAKNGLTTAEGK
jgi:phosphate transport system substrate-binding protein